MLASGVSDGYTLVSLGNALAGNHTLFKTPYDALKDIAPIATVLSYENVLVVTPSLPAMTLTNWQGVGGPVGIPKPIVDKISAEIARLVAPPDTKEKFAAQGFEPYYNNPEQTATLIKSDIAKYAKIIKDANIKIE